MSASVHAQTTPPALLSAQGLHRTFGAVVAADNVCIDVAAGEVMGLIGSNGAGKTTFVNMVTGYIKPSQGTIKLNGADITPLNPREIMRKGVARSFQIPQLWAQLTVLEHILVAASCSQRKLSLFKSTATPDHVAAAHALLARFGLGNQAARRVAELPGGVRKLLDIAMALTGQPSLLILDEPTSGVAAEEKFPMMETVMQAIAAAPVAVLFVEHDMEIVGRFAKRVAAFYSGKVIADGAPDAVLANLDVQRHVTGSAGHGISQSTAHGVGHSASHSTGHNAGHGK
jgi:branched-chain amino acid transport system ATP-binding protein